MPTLPKATTTIDDKAGAVAAGLDYLTVIGAVATSADTTPRVFTDAKALTTKHSYSDAADYCAMHFEETKKPIIFLGLPIVTAGAISQQDGSLVTGTSAITVAAGTLGCTSKTQGILTVTTGGTIGTSQIMFDLSLDGGRTTKKVRLGTATSYTIPDLLQVISFAAGTLVAGDVFKWRTSAGRWDNAGLVAAKTALAAQNKSARSWLVVGDCPLKQDVDDILTQVNAYETSNDRFVYARAQARAPYAAAKMSRTRVHMTGAPSLTFAEVGATGDTITRATGSWVTDGFAVGDMIVVSGTVSNNFTALAALTAVSATVLTLDTDDLVAEVTTAARIYASPKVVFLEVGATGDTITRTAASGSFIADGFRVGQKIVVTGTALNNITAAAGLTAVTATTLTLDTDDLANETIGAFPISITAVAETDTDWITSIDGVMAAVDDKKRIDIGAGEAAKASPITLWNLDRPVSWAASLREYASKDIHIPTWRKDDGALDGWDLEDANGNLVYHDERSSGGLLAARFTCFRTWANGPAGAFIAMSLTRATEASLLSYTHNMAVANVACSISQTEAENAIGQVLQLNSDGTGTKDSLAKIEERVNSALERNLLADLFGEGPRASKAVWKAKTNDVLNVVNATLNGVLSLLLNGTLVNINTTVKVQTG